MNDGALTVHTAWSASFDANTYMKLAEQTLLHIRNTFTFVALDVPLMGKREGSRIEILGRE